MPLVDVDVDAPPLPDATSIATARQTRHSRVLDIMEE